MNSDEREERLRRIRQRCGTTWVGLMQEDVEFLLSLVDSQQRDSSGLEYHTPGCSVDEAGADCICGAYRRNQAFLAQRVLLDSQVVHYQMFDPCAEGEHSDCIGYSNGLRRDGQQTCCSCACHDFGAATRMRDLCVARLNQIADGWEQDALRRGAPFSDRAITARKLADELQSPTLDQAEPEQSSNEQAPERIWINSPTEITEHNQRWWYENVMAFPTIEYVRADSLTTIREKARRAAIEIVTSVQNENELDDGGFFEAGFIAAKTKIIDALLE